MARRWLAVLTLILTAGAATAGPPTPDEVRSNARKAAGFEAFQKLTDGIVYEGKAEFLGIPGTFRIRLAPDGRYVRLVEAKGEQAEGFDGKTRWARNFSGPVRLLEMEEADRDRYLFAILCQRWLADDGEFTLAVAPEATTESRVWLTLAHRDAGVAARLAVNRTTWWPEQLAIPGNLNTRVIDFSEYREVAGVRFPARVAIGPGGGWPVGDG